MDNDTKQVLAGEALFRRGYLLWLARQLEQGSDVVLRAKAADVLRWVAEGVPADDVPQPPVA